MSNYSPSRTVTTGQRWNQVFANNKGALLIVLAQLVASSADAIVRFLQQGGNGMHPFQVIFARMSVTLVLSSIYMWWTKVPNFPLGPKELRGLLVIRGLFGFFGLWCLYYSIHYLSLAEGTIFRFLVPIITASACSLFLGQVFARKDLIAGIFALIGVVFIAHPAAIFGKTVSTINNEVDKVSPTQRLITIAIAIIGVFGASGAYTMIRVIGNRAHALISVSYFAFVSTVGSTAILLLTPGIGFTAPQGAREWVLLGILGILGFVLQFLLTAGLQLDRSSKATSMLYTQIVFALLFDLGIWGVLPGPWSIFGGVIVIASTLWSALQKPQVVDAETTKRALVDEESPLLGEGSNNAEVERTTN